MSDYEFSMTIVRSDGLEFYLGDGSEWLLSQNSMQGWDDYITAIQLVESILDDGSIVIGKRIESKDRTLTAVHWGEDHITARAEALRFFNPSYTFEARLKHLGRERWVEGEQIGFKCPIVDENTPLTITWTLLCPDPYTRDNLDSIKSFTDNMAGFGFPYVSHLRSDYDRPLDYPGGFASSLMILDGKNRIYNNGEVPVRFKAVIKAQGTLINPTIHKDDRFIKYLGTLVRGDELVIDLQELPPRCTLNGVNVIQKFSRDSSFTNMEMRVGSNVFSFEVNNPVNRSLAQVSIIFYKRYLGV